MPHTTEERAVALYQVREEFAGLRACFIDRAEISAQENAAIWSALQNASFLLSFNGVVTKENISLEAEEFGKAFTVALANLRGCNPAAVGAGGTVNCILDMLSDSFETSLDEIMAFEPGAELLISPRCFSPRRLICTRLISIDNTIIATSNIFGTSCCGHGTGKAGR